MGETVPTPPCNIFIELILPCIIFRMRMRPAGGPKYGALFVHVVNISGFDGRQQ